MKSWPGSWVTVWWVRKHSASNLEQKLIFWIIYIYFNCVWKLLSAPTTLSPWLAINSWRTNGRVKYPKHFWLRNMHLKCALGVFTVKHFKTWGFFWTCPFTHDLLLWKKAMAATCTGKKECTMKVYVVFWGLVFLLICFGIFVGCFCCLIIVLMVKPVNLFEQNLLFLNARCKKMYWTCNISYSITTYYLQF